MTDERRQQERVQRYTVVGIGSGDQVDKVGITRNVSETGALFHSSSKFKVGEVIVLVMVRASADGDEVEERIGARVVRTDVEPPGSDSHFPHLTAVEFDEPIDLPSGLDR